MSWAILTLLVYVVPLVLALACAGVLAPIRVRAWRMAASGALLLGCLGVGAWRLSAGEGLRGSAPLAAAVLIAVTRLLLDSFAILAERGAAKQGDSGHRSMSDTPSPP